MTILEAKEEARKEALHAAQDADYAGLSSGQKLVRAVDAAISAYEAAMNETHVTLTLAEYQALVDRAEKSDDRVNSVIWDYEERR
jgi:hypothetical protein